MKNWILLLIIAIFICLGSQNNQNPEFLVAFNFQFRENKIEDYQKIIETFSEAVGEWNRYLPIATNVFLEPPTMPVSTIFVEMIDFGEERAKLLGLWSASDKTIYLNANIFSDENFNKALAQKVCLHEIGHVFGLPHIVNPGFKNVHNGYIIAEGSHVMAPYIHIANQELSKLEVKLARRFIKNGQAAIYNTSQCSQ